MSSAPCGPSHHTGCACREAEWQRQLDAEREMRAEDAMSEIRDRDEFMLTVNRLMICAMEDIDCGRNEAGPTTLDLVKRIEDHDAALRLALAAAERERDEARACLSAERAIVASLCTHAGELESERDRLRSQLAALGNDLTLTRGAMAADDARLREAAIRVWGEHVRGCDTPDEMADLIRELRRQLAALSHLGTGAGRRAG